MSAKTKRPEAPKAPKRPAAKKARRNPFQRGSLSRAEIRPLVMAAREAYDFLRKQDLLEKGQSFDDWRRAEVFATVGKDGLTACSHGDYRPLMARFKLLAGKDDEAFALEMRTGKVTTGAKDRDTREARETVVHEIRRRLEIHIELADLPWPELVAKWEAESRAAWEIFQVEEEGALPWPGLGRADLEKLASAKQEIADHGGPIRPGYLVTLARQKTRRKDLTLGKDLWAGLAERLTVDQLDQLLFTVVNRIAAKEGTGDRHARNKGQRKPQRPAAEAGPEIPY